MLIGWVVILGCLRIGEDINFFFVVITSELSPAVKSQAVTKTPMTKELNHKHAMTVARKHISRYFLHFLPTTYNEDRDGFDSRGL